MKVVVLYKKNSEHYSSLEEFISKLRQGLEGSSVSVEVSSAETREGNAIASIYDIFSFPAILVLRDDGSVQNLWEGPDFPAIDEIKGYALA
ncbi:MAG: hypothetical protein M1554_00265 [Patescibacteria group bacterium]|jgi:hypothetical protein|nr:hypothetical protein [Patescibacteria group bacterium]